MANSLPSSDAAARQARFLLVLLAVSLASLGIFAALHLAAFEPQSAVHAEGLDDAYISYRYALNLTGGQGLVFNPGERLEGFSNLLWVLAAAGLLTFTPPDSLHFAVCLLNTLLAVAGLLVFHQEMRRRAGAARALIAAALWAFYPFLWIWIGSGLETIAVVLLQLLIWRSLSRDGEPRWGELGAWLSLAVLLRADGFVLVALAAGHFLANRQPRRALRALLAGLPATLLLFAFRLAYYHDGWPSTYYVKVTRGVFDRALAALGQLGELLSVFLLAPFVLALLWQLWSSLAGARGGEAATETGAELPRLPPELTLGGGLLAYWLYVGGDVFKVRFLLVLIPFGLAVIFGSYAKGLARRHALGLAALFCCAYAAMLGTLPDFNWQRQRYDAWINLGRFLGQRFPGALLATDGAGKVAYFSGLRTIDMLGLCDPHISKLPPARHDRPGHEKSDGAYVLARRPDVIVGQLGWDMGVKPDLSYEAYTAAGYRVAYLVNITPSGGKQAIIKAPAKGPDAAAISAGFGYAVLVRADPP